MTPGHDSLMLHAVLTGLFAFVATNIDDLFVLTMFFSQTGRGPGRGRVIAGQYLGFNALLAVSMVGFFGGRVLPREWMGCLGLAPVWIGVRRWMVRNKPATSPSPGTVSIASVAAVTVANGGDNIGIYTPIFANCDVAQLLVMLVMFQFLLALWCLVAHAIGRHPAVMPILTRYGHIIVPFVLIGLGIEIIFESGSLALLGF